MNESGTLTGYMAFAGMRRVAVGTLPEVARAAKDAFDREHEATILVFDDATSETIDLDFSLTGDELERRLARLGSVAAPEPEGPRGPGRPKLGVVAREVTLLPRHWEWLNTQPGGASVALRKLVEQARKSNEGRDRKRLAQESAYRFMSAMAGNLPGFEETIRALYADDPDRLEALTVGWPVDVRDHARRLASRAFAG